MTRLCQRMVEDMQLRGLAARTQEACLTAVYQLNHYCRKSPDQISHEELRQYFLYLVNGKKTVPAWPRSTPADYNCPKVAVSSSAGRTCGSGARLPCVACSEWFGSFARHDHDLDLVHVHGPSPPVPSGSAPHVEHGHTRDAEEQK